MNSLKFNEKKINFIKSNKMCLTQNLFFICLYVKKSYEDNDYNKIYEVLPITKNKKIEINNISIENIKKMLENPDFEQDY